MTFRDNLSNFLVKAGNSLKGEKGKSGHEEQSADSFLRKLVNWQNLRVFGQTKIAMATALTPFIGYIILYHDKAETFLGGLGGLYCESSPTTNWLSFDDRLHLLYLGLFLLGIGSILYRLVAPDIVKGNASPEEYTERVANFLTVRNVRMMFKKVNERNPGLKSPSKTDHRWLDTKAVEEPKKAMEEAEEDKFYDQVKLNVVRSFYNVESRYTNRLGAWIVSILYVMGGVVTAVPGFELSFRVLSSILRF